jgi:hypothetical protein
MRRPVRRERSALSRAASGCPGEYRPAGASVKKLGSTLGVFVALVRAKQFSD